MLSQLRPLSAWPWHFPAGTVVVHPDAAQEEAAAALTDLAAEAPTYEVTVAAMGDKIVHAALVT